MSYSLSRILSMSTIGRDLDCDQPLLGRDRISRVPCSITSITAPGGGAYDIHVKDTSKNVTFVDNVRLMPGWPYTFKHGSTIKFGGLNGPEFKLENIIQLRFRLGTC
ncbi:hypothetical protein BDY19DRAFT_3755 [Irpex rosettiformis]|uniref:Uncharacterized protein n=1 Tax=Irpex rosettiformis TaxID=378272 RepID=A0ACB8UKB6_9APHY|nr:hypothetical protein BDY19DRAFT_3755 [Irpex rosettiformis]